MKHSKHPHTGLQLSGLRIEDPRLERISELPGKYKTYSPEFCDEAARQVVETSRAIADVARELGISETSLGNWVRAYREKHSEDEPPLQVSERAQPQPRRDRTSATGGGDESAGRKLIPRPAVEYPAQPALADPAHPDGIRTSWYFHPVPALAAAVDEVDPAMIVTIRLGGKRAPLHR